MDHQLCGQERVWGVLLSEGLQQQRGQTCMHSQYKWCFDKKSLVSQYFFIKLCTNLIDEDRCLAEYVRENVCWSVCLYFPDCLNGKLLQIQHQLDQNEISLFEVVTKLKVLRKNLA